MDKEEDKMTGAFTSRAKTGSLAVFTLAILMCACGKFRSETQELINLINDQWRASPVVLPVGQVEVIRSQAVSFGGTKVDVAKGQVLADDFLWYEVLEKEGVIKITNNQDLASNRNFSWNNFFDLSQRGVARKVAVAVASEDPRWRCTEAIQKRVGRSELVCVDQGSGGVEEVVQSEKFDIGSGQYWFVMGNHRCQWSKPAKQVVERKGLSSDENRKFMVIAKYDPFSKKWAIEMNDNCARSESFKLQQQFDNVLASATNRQRVNR
jgi:hypothetical protein